MRPVVKWALIIAGVGTITVGLGLGLGLGLGDDCDPIDNGDQVPPSTTQGPPASSTTIPDNLMENQAWTKYGIVEGSQYDPDEVAPSPSLNTEHDSTVFLGIPYAAPPVGEHRWKSPKEPTAWEGVKHTKAFSPACAQKCNPPCPERSEDCLYLNVFTPTSTLTDNRKAAVGVWFHGGAFAWGAGGSPLYNGKFVAPTMDMVIVTVNYRLTAFGFLAIDKIEDGEPTDANWGFLDQSMAIKWVSENIQNFGGDPDRIMVFGQSAGAVSTTMHLLHPPSSDLIKNVVIHSNPHAIPFKENWEAKKQYSLFEAEAGCLGEGVNCLRDLDWEEIVEIVGKVPPVISPNVLLAAMPFSPNVDNYLFHKQPYQMLMEGNYNTSIGIISGSTQHETEIFIRAIFAEPISGVAYKAAMTLLINDPVKVEKVLDRYPPKCLEGQSGRSRHISPGLKAITEQSCEETLCGLNVLAQICKDSLVAIKTVCKAAAENSPACLETEPDERITVEEPGTEWIFTCPTRNWMMSHKGGAPYMYHFRAPFVLDISKLDPKDANQRALTTAEQPRMDGFVSYERCEYLSCHAAELSYTFEIEKQINCTALAEQTTDLVNCNAEGEVIDDDMRQMERMMHRYWGNFARTGDPNNAAGAVYSSDIQQLYDSEPLPRWTTLVAPEEGATIHFGYNTENKDDANCVYPTNGQGPCTIKFERNFKQSECAFWDSLDIYPDMNY